MYMYYKIFTSFTLVFNSSVDTLYIRFYMVCVLCTKKAHGQ